jgi:ABC-2 type transport system permease protein
MIERLPLVALTLRGLLDRKRTWLMLALAAVPVLLVGLTAGAGHRVVEAHNFNLLIVTTVLPLIALVFGTAALGSELEEGTVVYLLAKPVRRSRIVVAKVTVAAGLTAALIFASSVATGLAASLSGNDLVRAGTAFGVASALGGVAYVALFLTLSAFTTRALAIGLAYVMLWEGVLGGLLEGTRMLSVRQATLALGREWAGLGPSRDGLGYEQGLVILALFIVVAVTVATWRLSRYQLRGGD